jgi:hypothetical protein
MKRIQKKALAHYDRMIKWAEKQPLGGHADNSMHYELGESEYGEDCSYCKKYYQIGGCLLNSNDREKPCSIPWYTNHCCNGLWDKMESAKTWGTWIKYAKQVRDYIRENG